MEEVPDCAVHAGGQRERGPERCRFASAVCCFLAVCQGSHRQWIPSLFFLCTLIFLKGNQSIQFAQCLAFVLYFSVLNPLSSSDDLTALGMQRHQSFLLLELRVGVRGRHQDALHCEVNLRALSTDQEECPSVNLCISSCVALNFIFKGSASQI